MDPANYENRDEAFNVAWENHRLGEAMQIADAAMPIEWIAKGELAWAKERDGQCIILRDIFGPLPFRSVDLNPSFIRPNAKAVVESIYEDRAFGRLPIVANALEKAGCTNQDILNHCRGPEPHVRGCWAVDLVLGKE